MSQTNPKIEIDTARHSLAHILAAALQHSYPGAKFGVGPVIENGFYYDVELEQPLSADDLAAIEKQMAAMIKSNIPFVREELPIEDAIGLFKSRHQPYKVELLEDLKKHGTTNLKDIGVDELGLTNDEKITTVSLYHTGEFTDLCRGPHLGSTGQAPVFKLTSMAGAYWRGKEDNPQLQRIYGVAFATKDELNKYLRQIEEAAKRDHRKLGKQLDLFSFSPMVGPGLPLWTPRGTAIRQALQRAVEDFSSDQEVEMVTIPHLAKIDLYQASGHADKFGDELFKVKGKYQDFILKPVNCPHHIQLYASRPRSYRDLPIRYMESTMQYRDEKPGELSGLTRVRAITLDDGHTFCTVDQIKDEAKSIATVIKRFYSALGMYGDHWVSLSVRDPRSPQAYIGDETGWDRAEKLLQQVSDEMKLDAKRMEGEAALYGPKLDFMFRDAMGNERQLATIQIDFAMPARFEITYNDKDGSEKTPVMLHRAVLGSFERFMAILIEHFAGNFPVWLAPEQVRIATVNDDAAVAKRAAEIKQQLKAAGVLVTLDDSAESVGKKIRAAALYKVPYTIVVGEKETKSSAVTVRVRADLKPSGDSPTLELDDFINKLKQEISDRASHTSL